MAVSASESSNGFEGGLLDDLATSTGQAMEGVLARVWMVAPGDICPSCPMLSECADRTRCLHLASSAGVTHRTDGPFRRFPIGARRVGQVARTLEPYVASEDLAGAALADPAWLATHRVASFAALPIEHRGQCLGVLAVFSRRTLDRRDLEWLTFATRQAAFAIAQVRALAEVDRARAQLASELAARRAQAEPAERAAPSSGWLRPLRDLEREAIERVLEHTGGRVSGPRGAAAILGMKPTTLDSRIRKLGVKKPPRRGA